MSTFLGTLPVVALTPTTFDAPNDGVKAILIGNESGLTSIVTMEGGGVQKTLYPSTVDWFAVHKGFTGKIKINPIVILNNASSWPSSSLIFDAIGLNDQERVDMYPLALGRNTNVGNALNTVTSQNTLSNEGAAINAEVIDIGTVNNAKLLDLFNDHFVWAVEQLGVLHQVLKGQTAGNPLQIGQAGDVTEVLGKLTVDQATTLAAAGLLTHVLGTLTVDQLVTLAGHILLPNNTFYEMKTSGGATQDILGLDSTDVLRILSGGVGKQISFMDSAGTLMGWVNSGGGGVQNGKFSAGGTNGGITLVVGGVSRITIVSFNTVNGTTAALNHNLGVTPDGIFAIAFTTGVSAANVTIGISEVGATTFKASSIAAVPAIAFCIKL